MAEENIDIRIESSADIAELQAMVPALLEVAAANNVLAESIERVNAVGGTPAGATPHGPQPLVHETPAQRQARASLETARGAGAPPETTPASARAGTAGIEAQTRATEQHTAAVKADTRATDDQARAYQRAWEAKQRVSSTLPSVQTDLFGTPAQTSMFGGGAAPLPREPHPAPAPRRFEDLTPAEREPYLRRAREERAAQRWAQAFNVPGHDPFEDEHAPLSGIEQAQQQLHQRQEMAAARKLESERKRELRQNLQDRGRRVEDIAGELDLGLHDPQIQRLAEEVGRDPRTLGRHDLEEREARAGKRRRWLQSRREVLVEPSDGQIVQQSAGAHDRAAASTEKHAGASRDLTQAVNADATAEEKKIRIALAEARALLESAGAADKAAAAHKNLAGAGGPAGGAGGRGKISPAEARAQMAGVGGVAVTAEDVFAREDARLARIARSAQVAAQSNVQDLIQAQVQRGYTPREGIQNIGLVGQDARAAMAERRRTMAGVDVDPVRQRLGQVIEQRLGRPATRGEIDKLYAQYREREAAQAAQAVAPPMPPVGPPPVAAAAGAADEGPRRIQKLTDEELRAKINAQRVAQGYEPIPAPGTAPGAKGAGVAGPDNSSIYQQARAQGLSHADALKQVQAAQQGVTAATNNFTNAAQRQAAAFQASNVTLQQATLHSQTYGRTIAQTSRDLLGQGDAADGLANAMRKLGHEQSQARQQHIGQRRDYFTEMMLGGMLAGAGAGVLRSVVGTTELTGRRQMAQVGLESTEGAAAAPAALAQARKDAKDVFGAGYIDLINYENQLKISGQSADEARKSVLALSDTVAAAGGNADSLERIIINLAQIETQGKLTGRELRDFERNRIPVGQLVARNLGISQPEFRERVSRGDISAEMVRKAIIEEVPKDPRFAGRGRRLTEETLPGSQEKTREAWEETLEIAGDALTPALMAMNREARALLETLQAHPGALHAATWAVGGLATAATLLGTAIGVRAVGGLAGNQFPALRALPVVGRAFGAGANEVATELNTGATTLNTTALEALTLELGVKGIPGPGSTIAGVPKLPGAAGGAGGAAGAGLGAAGAEWGTVGVAGGAAIGALGAYTAYNEMRKAGYDTAAGVATGAFTGVAEAATAMFVPGGVVAVALVEGIKALADAKSRSLENAPENQPEPTPDQTATTGKSRGEQLQYWQQREKETADAVEAERVNRREHPVANWLHPDRTQRQWFSLNAQANAARLNRMALERTEAQQTRQTQAAESSAAFEQFAHQQGASEFSTDTYQVTNAPRKQIRPTTGPLPANLRVGNVSPSGEYRAVGTPTAPVVAPEGTDQRRPTRRAAQPGVVRIPMQPIGAPESGIEKPAASTPLSHRESEKLWGMEGDVRRRRAFQYKAEAEAKGITPENVDKVNAKIYELNQATVQAYANATREHSLALKEHAAAVKPHGEALKKTSVQPAYRQHTTPQQEWAQIHNVHKDRADKIYKEMMASKTPPPQAQIDRYQMESQMAKVQARSVVGHPFTPPAARTAGRTHVDYAPHSQAAQHHIATQPTGIRTVYPEGMGPNAQRPVIAPSTIAAAATSRDAEFDAWAHGGKTNLKPTALDSATPQPVTPKVTSQKVLPLGNLAQEVHLTFTLQAHPTVAAAIRDLHEAAA